jgi:NIMA-interacting peptidyl-prolyl cis-trans isomerase 1
MDIADAVAAAASSHQRQQQSLGPPPPLPPGWIMKESRSNPGYYYYFHMDTGLVSWDPPVVQVNSSLSIPQPMQEDEILPPKTTTAAAATRPPKHRQEDDLEEATIAIHGKGSTDDEEQLRAVKRRKLPATSSSSAPTISQSSSSSSSGPAEVRVLHILKKHKDSRRPSSWRKPKITQTKGEAHEELQGLLEILQEEEGNAQELRATFEELARTESDCSSAKRGGDLGFFGRKKMQPAFEEASFALKKGEMTKKIVDTSSGSHIILRIG